jgi:4-hydroxythreonine-4-phosphate dehydrogenase
MNVPGPTRLSWSFCSRDIMATFPQVFAMFLAGSGHYMQPHRLRKPSAMPLPRIAIATGDPAGIGPEIALKAAIDPRVRNLCRPLLVGDPAAVELHARASGLSPTLHVIEKTSGADWTDGAVNLLDARDGSNAMVRMGTVDAAYGRASLASASRAIKAALAKEVEAVVAAPQTERSIAAAGIAFDGYPSFVARETGTPVNDVYLMICFDQSRIVHATLHVSVREAVELITAEHIERVIRITDLSLKKLGIARPKIFVSGLNPHAGEEGLFGREEIEIIEPAIHQTAKDGIDVSGPFGADTMFRKKGADAFIVMLHDQGHIAAKLQAFNRTAGLSIGSPILFSSVAHGSAHDIAGKGQADPGAMIEAITRLARVNAQGRDG